MANQIQTINSIGQSNGSQIGGLTKEQYTQLMSLLNLNKMQSLNPIANLASKAISLSNGSVEWILDLGPSDHMICQKSILHSDTQIDFNLSVSIPDGSSVPVKLYREVTINPNIKLSNFFVSTFLFLFL